MYSFFIYHCDVPPLTIHKIFDTLRQDTDLMKVKFSEKTKKIPEDYVCTLEEELKPPALRPTIQSLMRRNEERIRKSKITISVE